MSLKKMLIKRMIRKNVKRLQSDAKKSLKGISRDVSKKIGQMRTRALS